MLNVLAVVDETTEKGTESYWCCKKCWNEIKNDKEPDYALSKETNFRRTEAECQFDIAC